MVIIPNTTFWIKLDSLSRVQISKHPKITHGWIIWSTFVSFFNFKNSSLKPGPPGDPSPGYHETNGVSILHLATPEGFGTHLDDPSWERGIPMDVWMMLLLFPHDTKDIQGSDLRE